MSIPYFHIAYAHAPQCADQVARFSACILKASVTGRSGPQIVGLYFVALFRHSFFAFRFEQFLHGSFAHRTESRQRLFAPRFTPASRRLRLVPGAPPGAGGGSPPGSGWAPGRRQRPHERPGGPRSGRQRQR